MKVLSTCSRMAVKLLPACGILLLSVLAITAYADSCFQCHSNPDLKVTHPKLFNYYLQWLDSPHLHAGLSCTHCHGGDSSARDKDAAHHPGGVREISWLMDFRQIPTVCGSCHTDILHEYEGSLHYAALEQTDLDHGPNCVTCHGSVDAAGVGPSQMEQLCGQCHASREELDSGVPARAEELLTKMVAIRRFQRYIALKGDAQQLERMQADYRPRLKSLTAAWHCLDLDLVEEQSTALMKDLRRERELLRARFRSVTPPMRTAEVPVP